MICISEVLKFQPIASTGNASSIEGSNIPVTNSEGSLVGQCQKDFHAFLETVRRQSIE